MRVFRRAVLLVGVVAYLGSPPSAHAASRRFPVLLESSDRVYIPWSEHEGARPGARVVYHEHAEAQPETLRVLWSREDVTALERPDHGQSWSAMSPQEGAWAEPLDVVAPGPAGTLRVPVGNLPGTLDPARATSFVDQLVASQVFAGLMEPGLLGSAPTFALADSGRAEDSPGGSAWIFHLDPAARFHDGRAVRASDVVASLERALAPSTHAPRVDALASAIAGARAYHDGKAPTISGLSAPDSAHVRIVAAAPGGDVRAALATVAASIVPADVANAPGFAFAPEGAGPFRYLRSDSSEVVLVAAPTRTDGVDTLLFRKVAGPEDAVLQFELGRLDVVSPPVADEARLLGAAKDAPTLFSLDEASTYYIGMNCRAPWLSSIAHRRALSAALDRALAVRVLVPGRGALARGLIPRVILGTHVLPDVDWQPRPEEAAALASMHPPAHGLSFWIPEGSETGLRFAEFAQAALARRGVRVNIVQRPWAAFERGVDAGDADLFYLSWYADTPDPLAFVSAMVASDRRGKGGNRTWYANAQVDSLLAVASKADPSSDVRGVALHQAESIALADAPLIPLFHSVNVALIRPWVRAFAPDPFGRVRYDLVEVTR